MKCPRCQTDLLKSSYEGVSVDVCKSCSGTWLDQAELKQIIEIRQEFFKSSNIKQTIDGKNFVVPKAESESRIPCAVCSKMMNTFIYGLDSGIVIDRCPESHGLWFDQGELEKVQMFREYWEAEAQKRGSEWEDLANSIKSPESKFTLSPFKILVNFFFD